jgi:hypothetical protein
MLSMFKTGYISFITETGGGFDSNMNPISSTKVNSIYYPCNLSTNTNGYKFIQDGLYVDASYSIYIDALDITIESKVQLRDNHENDLGVFLVQNKEFLDITKRIKIIV